jgi:hypothetical protein
MLLKLPLLFAHLRATELQGGAPQVISQMGLFQELQGWIDGT